MTRADIEQRIAELKKLQADALANANAIGGAIQDCEFWLGRLAEPAPEQEPVKPHIES